MNIVTTEGNELNLTGERIKQLIEHPIIKSTIQKSKDGRWIVHKTTILDIKPVRYYEIAMAQELVDSA